MGLHIPENQKNHHLILFHFNKMESDMLYIYPSPYKTMFWTRRQLIEFVFSVFEAFMFG